jgi:hypothetical protein
MPAEAEAVVGSGRNAPHRNSDHEVQQERVVMVLSISVAHCNTLAACLQLSVRIQD